MVIFNENDGDEIYNKRIGLSGNVYANIENITRLWDTALKESDNPDKLIGELVNVTGE